MPMGGYGPPPTLLGYATEVPTDRKMSSTDQALWPTGCPKQIIEQAQLTYRKYKNRFCRVQSKAVFSDILLHFLPILGEH